jgi:hypothetical protein
VRAADVRAELIEDRGEAAAGEEFFRSRQFLDAEGATHTLRIQGTGADGEPVELLAPLLVRQVGDGPNRDAVSPYGYPGLASPGGEEAPALDPATIDFSATGLVSLFIRHRLGLLPFTDTTPRNLVQIADPALPRKSRPSDRRQVRRNLEAGYEVQIVGGADAEPEQRRGFLDVYEQTMRRTDAAPHYFFGAAYFDRVLEAPRTWLAIAHGPEGTVAAASIASVSDGYLHYYLSGSADSQLGDSPMKNVVSELVDFAADRDLPLNLGGGIAPGDALEEFKRGFANRTERWQTSEIVCDAERYAQLSADREAGEYFPAYRAPR